MEKKVWEKPELIVLVRGKPEEAVLNACKGHGIRGQNLNNCKNNALGACTEFAPS